MHAFITHTQTKGQVWILDQVFKGQTQIQLSPLPEMFFKKENRICFWCFQLKQFFKCIFSLLPSFSGSSVPDREGWGRGTPQVKPSAPLGPGRSSEAAGADLRAGTTVQKQNHKKKSTYFSHTLFCHISTRWSLDHFCGGTYTMSVFSSVNEFQAFTRGRKVTMEQNAATWWAVQFLT